MFENKHPLPPVSPGVHTVQVQKGLTTVLVGRQEELGRLVALCRKQVNTILLGPQGIGKSFLLDNLPLPRVIRIGELSATKATIGGLVLELSRLRPERAELVFGAESNLDAIILKNTLAWLTERLFALTEPMEYTLVIDDVTRITPTGIKVLEQLKNHFHIVCAARKLKIQKATFLSNFERIDLPPLGRAEADELIDRLSADFLDQIGDVKAYRSHVYDNTQGNPLFIYEMIDRYRKEPDISDAVLRDIRHLAAREEINFLPFLVGLLACMSIMRYWGRISGAESGPFYMLAAIGVVFLFFGRTVVRSTKRKYV